MQTTQKEYEDYLKAHIKKYVVSKFLGRGQYEKTNRDER